MEISAENAAEKDLPANSESQNQAADGIVVDESEEMPSQLVNGGAVDKNVSASTGGTGEKTGEETKCQLHDGVKYEWTDITSDFISACSSLELGELVHDSKYASATMTYSTVAKLLNLLLLPLY